MKTRKRSRTSPSVIFVPFTVGGAATWVGVGLLAGAWLSTALIQVPCHRRLERGFDAAAHARLVRTNWIRTALWSARGIVALVLLA